MQSLAWRRAGHGTVRCAAYGQCCLAVTTVTAVTRRTVNAASRPNASRASRQRASHPTEGPMRREAVEQEPRVPAVVGHDRQCAAGLERGGGLTARELQASDAPRADRRTVTPEIPSSRLLKNGGSCGPRGLPCVVSCERRPCCWVAWGRSHWLPIQSRSRGVSKARGVASYDAHGAKESAVEHVRSLWHRRARGTRRLSLLWRLGVVDVDGLERATWRPPLEKVACVALCVDRF